MTCKFEEHLLIGYLYDEIDADDRAAVETHLADCPECRATLDALGATRDQLAAVPDPPLNEPILPLGPGVSARPWYRRTATAWLAAAVLALVALSLAVTKVEVRAGNGAVTIAWGGAGAVQPGEDVRPVTAAELAQWRTETEARLALMLAAEREEQTEILRTALNAFAERLDHQRREDLQMVGAGLEAMQWQSERRFQETDRLLGEIIQTRAVPGQRRNGNGIDQ